ncbi:MAG: arginine decarboxylase, pyruvoyl-dependent [Myxococcota bacterium]
MMFKQPTRYCLVAGRAEGYTELNAFDQALLAAGVGDTNLVRMSSILPPWCTRVESIRLPYGALVPVAYADMVSSRPGEVIAAAVAIGIPVDPNMPGLIMEHHGIGRLEVVEAKVREMAIQGMSYRNREIRDLVSVGIEHVVETHGAAFAGVVLWDESERGPLT